jgi:hypothetical protein
VSLPSALPLPLSGYGSFLPWVLPAAIVAGVLGIAVIVGARLSRRARGAVVGVGLAAGVAAMLAAPAAWSASASPGLAAYAGVGSHACLIRATPARRRR